MKRVLIYLEDDEHRQLERLKKQLSWRELILTLIIPKNKQRGEKQ